MAKSHARWIATVREATKQSRRAHVRVVGEAVDTAGLAVLVRAAVAGGGIADDEIATLADADGIPVRLGRWSVIEP